MNIHKRAIRWLLVATAAVLLAALTACNLTADQVRELEDEDWLAQLGGDPYIVASPDFLCPGELVTVEWHARDSQPESCATDVGSCVIANVSSRPDVLTVNDTLGGMETLLLDYAVAGTYTFYYTFGLLGEDSRAFREDSVTFLQSPGSPQRRVADIEHTYSLACDPVSNTWVWTRDDTTEERWLNESYSRCLGVIGVCTTATSADTYTVDGGGRSIPDGEVAMGTCQPSGVADYAPQDVLVNNTDPAFSSVIGSPCSPGDQPPVDPGTESFTVTYMVGCTDAASLRGPSASECVMGTIGGITSEEPTPTSSGPASGPICFNVPGDGICCSPAGEDFSNSPDDCPAPSAACGSPCANDARCAGLGVNPICAGGFCYDAQACEPEQPSSGGQSGGGSSSGGDSCPCEEVCTFWNYSAIPTTCSQYGYQDCNGNTCQP